MHKSVREGQREKCTRTLMKTMVVLVTSIRGSKCVANSPIKASGASSATPARKTALKGETTLVGRAASGIFGSSRGGVGGRKRRW